MNAPAPLIEDWPQAWSEQLAHNRAVTLGRFGSEALATAGVLSDTPSGTRSRRTSPPASTPPAGGWSADPLALVAAASWHDRLSVFGGLGPVPAALPDKKASLSAEALGLDTITLNIIDGPDGRPVAVLRRRDDVDVEVSLTALQIGIETLVQEAFPSSASGSEDLAADPGYVVQLTFFWRRRGRLLAKPYRADAEIMRPAGQAEAILLQSPALDADTAASSGRVDRSEATRRVAAQVDVVWAQATA